MNRSDSTMRLNSVQLRALRLVGSIGLVAAVLVYAGATKLLKASGWLVPGPARSSALHDVVLISVAVAAAGVAFLLWRSRPTTSTPMGTFGRVPRRRVVGAVAVGLGWGWLALGELDHHILGSFDFNPHRHPTMVETTFHLVGILCGAIGWAAATLAPMSRTAAPKNAAGRIGTRPVGQVTRIEGVSR